MHKNYITIIAAEWDSRQAVLIDRFSELQKLSIKRDEIQEKRASYLYAEGAYNALDDLVIKLGIRAQINEELEVIRRNREGQNDE